jgi:cytochrome P450 family 135
VTGGNGSSPPPGPRLPRWVQTLALTFFPVRFFEACHRRHGDVVTFNTLGSRFVIVFEPELVKQVYQASPEQLRAGKAAAELAPVLGERSVFLSDGADHMRRRKLLLPPLHGQRLRQYEAVMREAADRAIDSWPVGEPFELLPSTQSLAMEVTTQVAVGVEEAAREKDLQRLVKELVHSKPRPVGAMLLALSGGRAGSGVGQRYGERRRSVDRFIDEEILRRRAAHDLDRRPDVLSMLLMAQNEDGRSEDGRRLTEQELRDQLVTLLVAGQLSTAVMMAWAIELLLRNPAVLDRLRSELADGDDAYLNAVIKETLRMRPINPTAAVRVVCDQPYALGGHLIPPGMLISPAVAVIHRRPDHYPEPHAFRPERFLGPSRPDARAWIPFGGGQRRCIGASFATFEMAVVIRRVLERAHLAPVGRRFDTGVPITVTSRRGVVVMPKRGVRVVQTQEPEPPPP